VPTILLGQIPRSCVGVFLAEPSKDGPPNMMVNGHEDTLRAPCMPVEGAPTAQQRFEQSQTLVERVTERWATEDRGDATSQALRALLRDQQVRDRSPIRRTRTHA
jgi:hypothetical protein